MNLFRFHVLYNFNFGKKYFDQSTFSETRAFLQRVILMKTFGDVRLQKAYFYLTWFRHSLVSD